MQRVYYDTLLFYTLLRSALTQGWAVVTRAFDDNAKRERRLILGLAFAIAFLAAPAPCEGKPAA
ncbi:MAG TPA: hypothetical protein VFF88_03580, partial [Methylocella sp.]|nr:hypothetical protein [Methylocella sp.]